MERRVYYRMYAELPARLFYGNMVYTGTVTNLSENGMFISTRIHFPVDSVFMIVVLQDGHSFKLPIKVKRVTHASEYRAGGDDSGVGVTLLDPPAEYLAFVGRCRSVATVSR